MQVREVLFALLRKEICGQAVSDEIKNALSEEMLSQLYTLSNRHDLAHIIGHALEKLGVAGEDGALQEFKRKNLQAIYRYVRLDHEFKQLCSTLEQAQIPYLPLKGAVLRAYYPQAWMRTSCDVDILIHNEDLDKAVALLQEKLQYTADRKSSHDLGMFTPSGIHIELHFNLMENMYFEQQNNVLKNIWQIAEPVAGYRYQYRMPDAQFYFYHVAHMAKHIVRGGCGIKPFIDLWILTNCMQYDRALRETLLQQGGIHTFEQAAVKLCGVWLDQQQPNELTQTFERYIINGGMYGNLENSVAVRQNRTGGKLKFLMSRIFERREQMNYYFPILIKHGWLLPVFQVVRWFRLLFNGRFKRSVQELKLSTGIENEASAAAGKCLNSSDCEHKRAGANQL